MERLDAFTRLEKDVQAQAAQVEKIGNRLIEVGASDFLRERPAPLTPRLEGYEIALTLNRVGGSR